MEWLIVIVGGLFALAAGLFLLFGAVAFWPLTLVLGMVGYFLGGTVGGLIGAAISGGIALLFLANSQH